MSKVSGPFTILLYNIITNIGKSLLISSQAFPDSLVATIFICWRYKAYSFANESQIASILRIAPAEQCHLYIQDNQQKL